jgi:HSP20 family protein
MAEKQIETKKSEEKGLKTQPAAAHPFQMLERFTSEMDRLFGDVGFGRGWLVPRLPSEWMRTARTENWRPDIEMFQRNTDLIVRADLPGLKKDDVKVEITQDAVTIQGERRHEHEEEKDGVYRSERSYGSFCRVMALPEGAIVDQAKATFKDGVLEITMPAPPETVKQGRRLEIAEAKKE